MQIKRVMISSTAKDLPDHRNQVLDACWRQGMFPIMMEYLAASDSDAVNVSLQMVDEADIYLGIFANRYGYIPKGYNVSITELEYQRAIERGIPCLIFIIDAKHTDIARYSQPDEGDQASEKAQLLVHLKDQLMQKHVVSFFKSPDDLRALAIHALSLHRDKNQLVSPKEEPIAFSNPLRQQFALTQKTIQSLTKDQYEILKMLRYQKRVAIAGCAGSGKTLVAAEKAVRLDEQGLRTLLVCHSWYLAQYIKTLVSGTGVEVRDFTSWVYHLIQASHSLEGHWSHYQEPTDAELTQAFDNLVENPPRYDAILVDEGQDFRDEWWLLLEAAMISPEYGILYVFHDDNQALLPQRAKYPIPQAPIVLSKNCRNAGKVFDWVRKLHPQSPEPNVGLHDQGMVEQYIYPSTWAKRANAHEAFEDALQGALEVLKPEQLVILTTEPDPIETSSIYGMNIEVRPKWRWQQTVKQYLGELPFSDAFYPTPEDIQIAQTRAIQMVGNRDLAISTEKIYWVTNEDQLVLMSGNHRSQQFRAIIAFFTQDTWADRIPRPQTIQISSFPEANTIPFFTVSAFKGLEADGIILYIPYPYQGSPAELEASVYVGLSRARFLLHFVTDKQIASRLPHIMLSY